jgi:hypothetical protein
MYRILILFLICFFAASVSAYPEIQEISAITYNHSDDIPLSLGMLPAEDVVFIDWDNDGDQDILTAGSYRFGLIENVGTANQARFANSFENRKILLEDERVGRYFTVISNPGISNYPQGKTSILCFDRQTYTYDVGQVDLHLRMFIPSVDGNGVSWEIVPAYDSNGLEIEMFADTWICPTINAVDLNGDGKDDIIVGTSHPKRTNFPAYMEGTYEYKYYASRLYIMYNISDSDNLTFSDPVVIEADNKPITAFGYIDQSVSDINNDGLTDIVVSSHSMTWYRNTGTQQVPEFTMGGEIRDQNSQIIKSIFAIRPSFSDLNGDGCPEMITSSYYGSMSSLMLYEQEIPDINDLSSGWQLQGRLRMEGSADTPVTGQGIVTVDPIDWDNDGDIDIVLGAEPAAPQVLINKGSNAEPVWDAPQSLKFVDGSTLEWGQTGPEPNEYFVDRCLPRMADWDGDGVMDMVSGSIKHGQLFLRGHIVDGELRFEEPEMFKLNGEPIDAAWRVQPAVMDYDNDGYLDLIAINTGNVACLWRGNGTTELSEPHNMLGYDGEPLYLSTAERPGRKGIEAVDWNLDGYIDLLTYESWAIPPAGIKLYLGTENHMQFEEPVKLYDRPSLHTGGIGLADLNGDRYLDVFTGGDSKQLWSGFEPAGQMFILSGSELPVPPAKRPCSVFIVETYEDGRGYANFSATPNGYSSYAVSNAVGCTGTRSAYGGDGDDLQSHTYTFYYTPGTDIDNYSNGAIVPDYAGGESGLYNVYVSWPYSNNVSGGLTHITASSDGDDSSISVNQDGDDPEATPGAGDWVLIGESLPLSEGNTYTVTMKPSYLTYVSMRAQGVMWQAVLPLHSDLSMPDNPDPSDYSQDIPLEYTFSWEPISGVIINSQSVVIASDPFMQDITGIFYASGNSAEVSGLKNSREYYWRVDTQGVKGGMPLSREGQVWSFTTEPCNDLGMEDGDLSEDCRIDSEDVLILAQNWLLSGTKGP